MAFFKLNTGMPQLPLGGGYRPTPNLPVIRVPVPTVAPAGEGPIGSGSMIDRAAFLSHPPMGNRGLSGLNAIVENLALYQPWPY